LVKERSELWKRKGRHTNPIGAPRRWTTKVIGCIIGVMRKTSTPYRLNWTSEDCPLDLSQEKTRLAYFGVIGRGLEKGIQFSRMETPLFDRWSFMLFVLTRKTTAW